jgi:hypothetical protein
MDPYNHTLLQTFPWPVIAGYDDVHRWMDQGQAVHAAWQLRDVWEGLIKFLAAVAVADHLATAPVDDPRTSPLLADLLSDRGLSVGDWVTLMERVLKQGPLPGARLPGLAPLLYPRGKPGPVVRMFAGDETAFTRWRNECFGHGVFRKDLAYYDEKTTHWLCRLHDAYDLCREFFHGLTLESDGPNGEVLPWGAQTPLPFYHTHQPPAGGASAAVRVRATGGEPIPLSPLLTVQCCDVCGQWAAFSFDKYKRDKHRAWFLDFIEGHSNRRDSLEPLRRWTELVSEADWRAAAARGPDPSERREPDPERFGGFEAKFEPPPYLADQVAVFVKAHDRGAIRLTGPAGVGKSWFCRGLLQPRLVETKLGRAVPLLYASLGGSEQLTPIMVFEKLADWARLRLGWSAQPPTQPVELGEWLDRLMHANVAGELLVALDGWDDLAADSEVPDLLPRAGDLPRGCYLILAGRRELRRAAAEGMARVCSDGRRSVELTISPQHPLHRRVLWAYTMRELGLARPEGQLPLPPPWVEPLIDLAGGSFLYVAHYCHALRFGVYKDLSNLPAPADFYPRFFDNLKDRVGKELFERYYSRVLTLIAEFEESGISLSHLSELGLERVRLAGVLEDLAGLLHARRGADLPETLYSLGHETIAEFLSGDAWWRDRARKARQFLVEHAVRRFSADWSGVDMEDRLESDLLGKLILRSSVEAGDESFQSLRHRLHEDVRLARAFVDFGDRAGPGARFRLHGSAAAMLLSGFRHELNAEPHAYVGNPLLKLFSDPAPVTGDNPKEGLPLTVAMGQEFLLVNEPGQRELRRLLAKWYVGQAAAHIRDNRKEEAVPFLDDGIRLYEALARPEAEGTPTDARRRAAAEVHDRGRPGDGGPDTGRWLRRVPFLGRLARWLRGRRAKTSRVPEYALALPLRNDGPQKCQSELLAAYGIRKQLLRDLGRDEPLVRALREKTSTLELLESGPRSFREPLPALRARITTLELLNRPGGPREHRIDLARTYLTVADQFTHQAHPEPEQAFDPATRAVRVLETLVREGASPELTRSLARAYLLRGRVAVQLGLLAEEQGEVKAAVDRLRGAETDLRLCIDQLRSVISSSAWQALSNFHEEFKAIGFLGIKLHGATLQMLIERVAEEIPKTP